MPNTPRRRAYLAMLTTSLIWGLAPPIIKYTLNHTSPITFLFYRFLLASLILALPLALRIKKVKPSPADWRRYLFLGFLGTPLTLLLLFTGIRQTTATSAAILSIMTPILVVLGGAFLLKERVEARERLGIGLTLAGSVITIAQPLIISQDHAYGSLPGNLLVFLGWLTWAGFTLLAKRNKQLDPFLLAASSSLVGLAVFLPFMLFQSTRLPLPALPGIVYMSLLGSVVAYFAYTYGLAKIEASEATLFTYLQPVLAIPVAVIFLKESLSIYFVLGAGLIIAGVFLSEKIDKKQAS